jgi:hypothetical protein
MNHSETSFFFPKTNTINSDRETVFFDYSGTKESFDEVISKVKKT